MSIKLDRTYTDKGLISAGSGLYVKEGNVYHLLIPTTDLPAHKSAPDTVEKTVLTDSSITEVEGLQTNDQKEYTFNYHRDNIRALKKFAGSIHEFIERNGMDFTGEKFTGSISMGRDAFSTNGIMQGKFWVTVNSADEYPVDDIRDLIQKTAIIYTPLPDMEIVGTGKMELDLELSEGASVTAKVEGSGVASVTAVGNKITVTGIAAGTEIVELTCSASNEATSKRTFMVSVVSE